MSVIQAESPMIRFINYYQTSRIKVHIMENKINGKKCKKIMIFLIYFLTIMINSLIENNVC